MSAPGELDLGIVYREARQRIGALVAARPETGDTVVPACPGWTVQCVTAHLVAVVEDVLAGRLTRPPSAEETAEQVARRSGRPVAAVVAEWDALAPQFEAALSATPVWPAALDVLSHEQDIRGAIGERGARDVPGIVAGARRLVQGIPAPVDLLVHLDGEDYWTGPDSSRGAGEGPALELTTTSFEAFRFRLGRRSRPQLAALAWSGDPAPVLDHLTIFGPSPTDIVE
jgi:uncharacterized protein (TIGR03083 family)